MKLITGTYTAEIVASFVEANQEGELLFLVPTLLNPKSRGTIELRSVNPFDSPIIKHNYLMDQDDVVDTVVRSIRILQPNLPACDKLTFDSDKYWECYVRYYVNNIVSLFK